MPTTGTPRRGRRRVRRAVAAGGVVYRHGPDGLEVVLAGRLADATWVFPKGQPDANETLEQTALREVREETGLQVRAISPLGQVEYWFAAGPDRVRKAVHFYLMEPIGGDTSLHDQEYDLIRWVPVREARRLLSFETYREVLHRALAAIAA